MSKSTTETGASQQEELQSHLVSRLSGLGDLGWRCAGDPEAVSFTVSKNISLVGCQLYGPWNISESIYRLNVVLYDDQDQVIAQPVTNTDWKYNGEVKPKDVMFLDPVPLVAGRTYTICVNMIGEDSLYGKRGSRSVTVEGVSFTFSD